MKRVGHTHTSHYPTIKLEMGGVGGGGWEVGGGKGSERNTHTRNCPAIEFEISSNRPECKACNSWKNPPSKIILCEIFSATTQRRERCGEWEVRGGEWELGSGRREVEISSN